MYFPNRAMADRKGFGPTCPHSGASPVATRICRLAKGECAAMRFSSRSPYPRQSNSSANREFYELSKDSRLFERITQLPIRRTMLTACRVQSRSCHLRARYSLGSTPVVSTTASTRPQGAARAALRRACALHRIREATFLLPALFTRSCCFHHALSTTSSATRATKSL